MTRREAASIEYPPVIQTSRTTLLSQRPKKPSDILSLTRIPSESTCQHMKELCLKGNYVAVDCDIGAFTLDSIELLLKIHSLRNVKHAVLKEQQWLKKEINLPDSACSYSKEHLVCYAEKIFNTPNHHSPLPSNRCILASDLATIAGTGWLNFCVITGITEPKFSIGTARKQRSSRPVEPECEYALKLIFLKCIFEFMINAAPPASNSVYGREKLF